MDDEAEEEGVEDGELFGRLSFVEKLVLDVWLMSASWNIFDEVFRKGRKKGKKKKEGREISF